MRTFLALICIPLIWLVPSTGLAGVDILIDARGASRPQGIAHVASTCFPGEEVVDCLPLEDLAWIPPDQCLTHKMRFGYPLRGNVGVSPTRPVPPYDWCDFWVDDGGVYECVGRTATDRMRACAYARFGYPRPGNPGMPPKPVRG